MTRWMPCPSCSACDTRIFYEVADVPVNSVLLLDSAEEARRFPRGDIELAFCERCGFVFNAAFDAALVEYSSRYEETQGYSPTFQQWHQELARDLVDRYQLHDKTIVEVGCGKGEFLTLLCRLGNNRGIGFDPAWVPGRNPRAELGGVAFVRDFYSEEYAHVRGDMLCCKMTLEHIPETRAFVEMVHRAVEDGDTLVLFQVPDVLRILRDGAFWDVYYEHCSYFSEASLAGIFRRCGFDVARVDRQYDDQYLLVEARPGAGNGPEEPTEDVDALSDLADRFAGRIERLRGTWQERMEGYERAGRRVVVWGSGSKGVAFLTTLGVGDAVDAVVDINPHRQGCFMAGTGHPIVSPEDLRERPPDVVVVMNPIYRDEIVDELDRQGLSPEVLTP